MKSARHQNERERSKTGVVAGEQVGEKSRSYPQFAPKNVSKCGDNFFGRALRLRTAQKVIHIFGGFLGIKCRVIHMLSTKVSTLSRKTKKVIHTMLVTFHISTEADGERRSYPHYPQFIHKVIPRVIHTGERASRKLSTQC